jgi:hypothetical protein
VADLFHDGLAGLRRIGQHGRIDMDHYLIPLTRCPRIQLMVQRRLREQGQRVRLLLGSGGRLQQWIGWLVPGRVSRSLIQRLPGCSAAERPSPA